MRCSFGRPHSCQALSGWAVTNTYLPWLCALTSSALCYPCTIAPWYPIPSCLLSYLSTHGKLFSALGERRSHREWIVPRCFIANSVIIHAQINPTFLMDALIIRSRRGVNAGVTAVINCLRKC